MAERVRRHALALVDAARLDVVAEELAELGVVEPVALDADEQRLLASGWRDRVVLGEERRERGVDRDRPLPAALRLADPQQPAREVDVVPVEAEQLAAAQARRRPSGRAAAGRAPACRGSAAPRSRRGRGCASRRSSSPIVSTSGSASRFFGVRSGSAGSRRSRSSSTRKRKKHFSAAVVRAWLETAGRRVAARSARNARRCVTFTSASVDPLTLQVIQTRRNVTLVRRASHRGKPPLRPAKAQEIGQFLARLSSSSILLWAAFRPPLGEPCRYSGLQACYGRAPRERGSSIQ